VLQKGLIRTEDVQESVTNSIKFCKQSMYLEKLVPSEFLTLFLHVYMHISHGLSRKQFHKWIWVGLQRGPGDRSVSKGSSGIWEGLAMHKI
jgi:hypothetical protein